MATTEKIIIQYETDIAQLKSDMKKVQDELNKTEKAADSAVSTTDKGFKGLTRTFKSVAIAAAAAFSVREVVNFAQEVANLAAQAEGVEKAFKSAFTEADLSKLRKSVQGTVSDIELMKQAVRARNFKIPLDLLAKGFEFATRRAADTGESVDYLVESIINGVGRKSPMILDNLGISASELQEEFKKTGDFAGAVGSIIEREMANAGETTLTTAQRQSQLRAKLEQIKLEIGRGLLPVVNTLLSSFSNLADKFLNLGPEQTQVQKLEQVRGGLELNLEILKDSNLSNEARGQLIKNINKEYGKYLPNLISEKDTLSDIEKIQREANKQLLLRIAATEFQEEFAAIIRNRSDAIKSAAQSEIDLQKVQRSTETLTREQIEGQETLRNVSQALADQASEETGPALEELNEKYKIIGESIGATLDEIINFTGAVAGDGGGGTGAVNAVNSLKDEMEELRLEALELEHGFEQLADSDFKFWADDEGLNEFTQNLTVALDKMQEFASDESTTEFFDNLLKLQDRQEEAEDVFQQLFGFTGPQISQAFAQLTDEDLDALEQKLWEIENTFGTVGNAANLATSLITSGLQLAGVEGEKFAKFQKAVSAFEIGISIAKAIAQGTAIAQTAGPFPANLGAIIATIAAVAAQAAKAKQLFASSGDAPKYAGGVIDLRGPGTSTSDSIPAWLSKGESVMTAEETRKHRDILESIRNNKLDEYINEKYGYDDSELRHTIKFGYKKADKNTNRIVSAILKKNRVVKW